MLRKLFRFEGRVQHVGFRYTASILAKKHALTGWVRNEFDGSVVMEVQGTEQAIEMILYQLMHDSYIRIDDFTVKNIPAVPEEKRFSVLHY